MLAAGRSGLRRVEDVSLKMTVGSFRLSNSNCINLVLKLTVFCWYLFLVTHSFERLLHSWMITGFPVRYARIIWAIIVWIYIASHTCNSITDLLSPALVSESGSHCDAWWPSLFSASYSGRKSTVSLEHTSRGNCGILPRHLVVQQRCNILDYLYDQQLKGCPDSSLKEIFWKQSQSDGPLAVGWQHSIMLTITFHRKPKYISAVHSIGETTTCFNACFHLYN